jgi:hypothetical protein
MLRGLARLSLLPLVVVLLTLAALTRTARADQPGAHTVPVAVLAFDSEDAEEQADAITGALRSRVRAAPGWSLIETTQSLGMLTAALKCTSRPTADCQQRIAEQIKADRYIWGFVAKGPSTGQVTAEIHLYQKGKPDTVLKEAYADNLKDGNDDTLRKIAARIVDRLGGAAVGVIIVRNGDASGEVIVDGEKHVPLEKGTARIELGPGGHSVEVAPIGGAAVKRNILVAAGKETVVDFTVPGAGEAAAAQGRSNTRKIIGGVSMGAGALLGVIAVVELIHYLDLQSQGTDLAATLDKKNDTGPCRVYNPKCADLDSRSKSASGLAIALGAGGALAVGFGAYLFFTTPAESSPPASAAAATPKVRVIPSVGAGSGGLVVLGAF